MAHQEGDSNGTNRISPYFANSSNMAVQFELPPLLFFFTASPDRVIVIEGGKIISDAPSQTSAQILELDPVAHSRAERPVAVAG
ncbi:MAG: hypothetical protein EBU46_01705 [Nitrosomonadaceae bacterium]|nr:hypothetical protein [Nitrosomonadaceae bacterium]